MLLYFVVESYWKLNFKQISVFNNFVFKIFAKFAPLIPYEPEYRGNRRILCAGQTLPAPVTASCCQPVHCSYYKAPSCPPLSQAPVLASRLVSLTPLVCSPAQLVRFSPRCPLERSVTPYIGHLAQFPESTRVSVRIVFWSSYLRSILVPRKSDIVFEIG